MDAIAFSPDGHVLAVQSRYSVDFWSAMTGEKIRTIDGIGFTSLSFSPDGKVIATGSKNGLVDFWDVETGNLLFEYQNIFSLHQ